MRRRATATALLLAMGVTAASALPATAETPPDLFFSEYVEGSGYNKAVEIYNGTGADVDLSAYSIEAYQNGNGDRENPNYTIDLSGTLADGDVFVVVSNNSQVDPALAALADATSGGIQFNGDDALLLLNGTDVVDSFGQVGVDPGSQWPGGGQNDTLVRFETVCAGDTDPLDAFDASVEWDVQTQDTFAGLGSHTADCGGGPVGDVAPTVASIAPADGAVGVSADAVIALEFSEPVVADGAVTLSCTDSGDVALSAAGGPSAYTYTPAAPLSPGETCAVAVSASAVTDVDADDPPDAMEADFASSFTVALGVLPISEVQGAGDASPYDGQVVTVEGVVVGDYEGSSPNIRGFYVQSRDEDQDGDPATSEGIFVFHGNEDTVSVGDVVSVTGTVDEYFGQTQIGFPDDVTVLGTGASVAATEVTLPFASADVAERYEGMLVTLPQELFVTELFRLGRFGELALSVDDRLAQPTAVAEPGAAANAVQAANDLSRIILDDGLLGQNPDPIRYGGGTSPLAADNPVRGGDSITGLTGVMTYTWGGASASPNAWRIQPVTPDAENPEIVANNPRPASAPEVGGSLQVASFNVLNYFLTVDASGVLCGPVGSEQGCRGADATSFGYDAELERQTDKLVAALLELDADVIGVMEMENTQGVEPLGALADRLNAVVGAGTWSYVDTGVVGTDVIRVGILYDTTAVAEAGTFAVLDSGVDPRFDDGRNRPSVAQSFEELATGETFTVVTNHWKSKGSCPSDGLDADQGDGAGCWNETRRLGAEALVDWLGTYPTGVEDDDVMIIGDLNSYAMEDPIDVLRDAGYIELGGGDYSYVFDGQWGSLDYVFGSASLAEQVTDSAHFHINSDEASVLDYNINFKSDAQVGYLYAADMYRTSDHDPVLVGLDLYTPPPICTATYKVHGEWPGGFIAQVWVHNQSDQWVTGWETTWSFTSDEQVWHPWSGVFSQDGQDVSVSNKKWNGKIWPGGKRTFGFVGSTADGVTAIDGLAAACEVAGG